MFSVRGGGVTSWVGEWGGLQGWYDKVSGGQFFSARRTSDRMSLAHDFHGLVEGDGFTHADACTLRE